jgi:C4-dicarboxylate transporter
MAESAYEWVARFAEELGTSAPDKAEFNALLGLASLAAHASERTAAPVACWVAARAGIAPADAMAVARRLRQEAAAEDRDAPDGGDAGGSAGGHPDGA